MNLVRSIGFAKQADYHGDLHEIALYPNNNLPTAARMNMLEDHYRRTAYADQPNPWKEIAKSGLKGAGIGAAAVFVRQSQMERQAGTSLMKSMSRGFHAAKWPAPLVGAMVGAPLGVIPYFKRKVESIKAHKVMMMPTREREMLLHGEVSRALR